MADAITEWNLKAGELIAAAKPGPATARRAFGVVQTAAYGAVNAVTQRYPAGGMEPGSARGGSIEAAVASANRTALLALVPAQKNAIEAAYQAALAKVAEGPAKASGIAVGQKSAAAILAVRASDLADPADDYHQPAMPEGHVQLPPGATGTGPQRTPWLMGSAGALRPEPPPAMNSTTWAREYNEAKNFGGTTSTRRTAEQTAIARFWEDDTPSIFYGLVASIAQLPGREVTQNARLYMAVAQAADDATIAAFDAKYAYNFPRPVDAIRNGAADDNPYTAPDANWSPLGGDKAAHPEYPCYRCLEAAAVGAVLKLDIGKGELPTLTTVSRTLPGTSRQWNTVEDMLQEVADARVQDGEDYRTSTVVAMEMGERIGELVAAQLPATPPGP